ncbi:hypothetical protein [Tenacibaculum amylolyticum]|uniref:hypothetical protein n=1 Tax=Tenacibaculum amylolyticum TaxID=104269 RepID=UPI003894E28B
MKQEKIYHQLQQLQQHYRKENRSHYLIACKDEHLQKAAKNLHGYFTEKHFLKTLELPAFEEEQEIDRPEAFMKFQCLVQNNTNNVITAIEKTTISDFLIILGQRVTPATVRSIEALPPLHTNVFKASFVAHNTQISKAVRAFEKHAERSTQSFWGTVKGNPKQKETHVQQLIIQLLENTTWWNVFYHYKHEFIYEVRIASGHGARWKKSNLEFIGFVEPFIG